MKTKILVTLLALSSVFYSCKNDGKKTDDKEAADVKQNFNVELEASTSKSDDFAMYFSEDNTVNFEDVDAKWAGIKGGGKFQKIAFDLTEEKVPTHIRLDFGLKADQDSVVVKNVKVNFYGNKFEFTGADFFKYFIEDKQFNTKVDVAAGTLTIMKKDGVYKTPYYYPNQTLVDNIKKISTSNK